MTAPKARRSRTGCVTCRGRKVRCDEQRPICSACTRLRLTCRYVEPGDAAGPRKNARARPPKFRVRFVDANAPKGQSQGQVPEAELPSGPTPLPTIPSPGDMSTTSSASSYQGMTSMGSAMHEGNDFGSFSRLTLSPVWSSEIVQGSPSKDPITNFDISYTQNSNIPIEGFDPEAVERMLDSICFQPDMGFAWDSMPKYGNSEIECGDIAPITNATTYEEVMSTNIPSTSMTARVSEMGETVTIHAEDRVLLDHYLSTMVQFAKLRSSATDNIYCYIFTNMGLTHAPLYEAIMAWSSLHLSHVRSLPSSDAEARYQRAAKLLYNDVRAVEHVDLTLVTVWILLQYELFSASGVDRFIRLLNYVADVVEGIFKHHHIDDVREQLGPVGLRMLMWLSAYDSRAALIGNPCRLLRCLRMNPSIYNIVESKSGGSSDHTTAPIDFGNSESKACLRLAMRLNIVRGSCIVLGNWQGDGAESEYESSWITLHSSLESIWKEVEESTVPASKLAMRVSNGDMDIPVAISSLEYNWIQLLATYYSILIIFMQRCPRTVSEMQEREAGPPPWPSIEKCAARIIRLSRHVTLSRPDSPQAIWPQALFQAGVETNDPIYQSWVLTTFAQAETWGPNLRRTRLLLERIIKFPKEAKANLDIIALMEDLGGPFVV
ncbi:uncharacterized protein F4822DRAFT_345605 [Hypoxylon trugodes]|uniref:uncharacterized protein n=1 Tax=Hypoxylon trugodes TaxID=326681 RepID=UPI00219E4D99|nr:uncharacterized protein F4822DRAFT_345605 [Hypoxylon trugodes]KAI1385491.1 hypothetical protein F4822DRAFT_345605 [Hypoxylon trugodes]